LKEEGTMSSGYICFLLHAHLPFVRHPEQERFLEENWLFEAISECYLPLLRAFGRLREDRVPFRITLSISPTLAAMLTDELLQNRYLAHLKMQQELAARETERVRKEPQFIPVVRMYKELIDENLYDFTETYRKNILKGFKSFEKEGYIDIITTAATHSFLPLYQEFPEAVEAQVNTAVISHGRIFGKEPSGFWLPECGYYPGLEKHLKANNLKYFMTAAHGVLFSQCEPRYGVYGPIQCPNGVAVFGRDIQSTASVWSAEDGYPGDQSYRDFYRDIGFDLPLDYIRPFIHEGDIRIYTGFKYYAVTGRTDQKRPYNEEEARGKVVEHAENFLYNRMKQVKRLSTLMDRPPLIVSPYDAELFGHWWFEGPLWLESLFRKMNNKDCDLRMITPLEYLSLYPSNQTGEPSFSSWGNKGYAEVWLNSKNDWIYRHIHKGIERMKELALRFPDEKGLKRRTLNQAAREIMLAMASDWPFIMKNGTTVPYAVRRVKEHIYNFTRIYENLCRNTVNTEWLTSIEKKNTVFPDIDYRIFAGK
jgi:1,4-alpha-glucan branching enzyme